MKKTAFLFLIITNFVSAQIGVNTANPQATFDVNTKNTEQTSKTPEGLLIPRVDRLRAQSMSGIIKSTLLYIDNVSTGTQTENAINIDEIGYYQFDGKNWIKLNTNIYNANGTLSENRIVSQTDKTLAFTGTATNAFSVDGKTFSVDAKNNKVGIGTIAPTSILSVINSTAGSTTDAFTAGINNCGSACGQGTARNISLFNGNKSNTQFATIDFIPSVTANGITGAAIRGIDRDEVNNYAGLQFLTRNATDYNARMTIRASGNVGIGTSTPVTKLDIYSGNSGAVKIADGTQGANKVLTSDANGVATWQPVAVTFGSVNITASDYFLLESTNACKYVGVPITLPPGKWLLNLNIGIEFTTNDVTSTENCFIRFRLGDNTNDMSDSGTFISDSMSPKLASAGLFRAAKKGMVNGNLAVNNTSGANKTYYLFVDNTAGYQKVETWIHLRWNETSITYQKIQ